ncbi:hypothetical protein BDW02DRAFT_565283 [Decorospora gaudefroyi]|uniref:MYND-type domain-containing protein n=1 Tax=Decorospora gaudefroyi TaxID=184978 RepID=A0A6A5KQC5_9PLEO|nr:hypothetical protein BDW02DRAFT_565283 [Decorospora gaudefroyi]
MSTSTPSRLCTMCPSPGTQFCPKCQTAYCSQTCYKDDWPLHKLLCKTFSSFSATTRPHPFCVRALYFSETETRPRFFWQTYTCPDTETFAFALPPMLTDTTDVTRTSRILRSDILHRPLPKCIQFGFRVRSVDGGKKEMYGQHPASFSKIDKELVEHGRGPMFALATYRHEGKEKVERPADLDMADFRYVVDRFRYCYDRDVEVAADGVAGEKVHGVRVNCVGDQVVFSRPEFEPTLVNLVTGPLESMTILHGPEKLGLPYVFGTYENRLSWRGRHFGGMSAESNCSRGWLTSGAFDECVTDPETQKWSMATSMGNGSIFVVRKDKVPLLGPHVQALVEYLEKKMIEFGTTVHEQREEDEVRLSEYLEILSKEDFVRWYGEWVEKHQSARPELVELPSPYGG